MTVKIVIWQRGRVLLTLYRVAQVALFWVVEFSCRLQLYIQMIWLIGDTITLSLMLVCMDFTDEDQKQVLNFPVTNLDSPSAASSSQYKLCITKGRSYRYHLLAFCYCCALFQKRQPKACYILHCCWQVLERQMRVTPVIVCILMTIRTVCVNSLKSSPNNRRTSKGMRQKTEIWVLIAVDNSDI